MYVRANLIFIMSVIKRSRIQPKVVHLNVLPRVDKKDKNLTKNLMCDESK